MGEAFFQGHVPKVVQLFADLGHDIIVDEVIFDRVCLDQYLLKLTNHTVYVVQIICEYDVLLERERLRGDRVIGLANDQFDRLQSYSYDYNLTVDTSCVSAIDNARQILGNLRLHAIV
jgi:chloramphenicol 3-O phosphotransferase